MMREDRETIFFERQGGVAVTAALLFARKIAGRLPVELGGMAFVKTAVIMPCRR